MYCINSRTNFTMKSDVGTECRLSMSTKILACMKHHKICIHSVQLYSYSQYLHYVNQHKATRHSVSPTKKHQNNCVIWMTYCILWILIYSFLAKVKTQHNQSMNQTIPFSQMLLGSKHFKLVLYTNIIINKIIILESGAVLF